MKAKVNRDYFIRKFIYAEISLFSQKKTIFSFNKLKPVCHVRNSCIYSNKSRSVFSQFKCSRFILRLLIHQGKIPGIIKK